MDHQFPDIPQRIVTMSQEIQHYFQDKNIDNPLIVGLYSDGVRIAKLLHQALKLNEPLGELNVNFYRDDFGQIGIHHQIKPSQLPTFGVDGRHILLVDDVLYTGRTIRAAMNEIFDYGRPASIALAVLVSRTGRELPIEAQFIGYDITTTSEQMIKLNKQDPLELIIRSVEKL